jgi:phospholipid/cholesterol/gamma-HCH transport system ATP-binding protein
VIVVTHDLATLFSICDRVALLVDGKLTVDTVEELRRSDQPWIREFLHGARANAAMAARRF